MSFYWSLQLFNVYQLTNNFCLTGAFHGGWCPSRSRVVCAAEFLGSLHPPPEWHQWRRRKLMTLSSFGTLQFCNNRTMTMTMPWHHSYLHFQIGVTIIISWLKWIACTSKCQRPLTPKMAFLFLRVTSLLRGRLEWHCNQWPGFTILGVFMRQFILRHLKWRFFF